MISRRQMMAASFIGTSALLGSSSAGIAGGAEEDSSWLLIPEGETWTAEAGTNSTFDGVTMENSAQLVFEPDASLTLQSVGEESDLEAQISVETTEASDIDESSVNLSGELTELQGYDEATCYFEYRNYGSTDWNETTHQSRSTTGSFDEIVTGLESDTRYEFRGVVEAGDSSSKGTVRTFSTDKKARELGVKTGETTDVDDSASQVTGELTELEGYDAAECYFEYRPYGSSDWSSTTGRTKEASGTFGEVLDGLFPDTVYEYRAVAAVDDERETGETRRFETDQEEEEPEAYPVIGTFDVSTRTTGPWLRADVKWEVSDPNGDLDTVTTELLSADGLILDREITSVTGETASDRHNLRSRNDDPDVVRLTVSDLNGNRTTMDRDIIF